MKNLKQSDCGNNKYSGLGQSLYNAASRIVVAGGRHAVAAAAMAGMIAQNFETTVYGINVEGTETVPGGDLASDYTVSGSGNILNVYGRTDRTMLINSGLENIYAGGLSVSASLSGGIQAVYQAGIASGATICSGGAQFVHSGGIASGGTIYGSSFQVLSGGNAYNAVISNLGQQYVFNGGTATSTIVESGGFQEIDAFGHASATIVMDGGTLNLYQYAFASGIHVSSGGILTVYSGNLFGAEIYSDGKAQISESSYILGLSLHEGARFEIAVNSDTFVEGDIAGNSLFISNGIASSIGIGNGDKLYAVNHARLVGNTINSGGTEHVLVFGSSYNAAISNGGTQIVSAGSSYYATLNSGATQTVMSAYAYDRDYAGFAFEATISSGGVQTVSAGGVTVSAAVSDGGSQIVYSGGTAENARILSGGIQTVMPYGLDKFAELSSGGTQIVSGGSSLSASVLSGGIQQITDGGIASLAIVDNGGSQNVSSGGIASHALLISGGQQTVYSDGTASRAAISAGGQQTVLSGGIDSDTEILSGGIQILEGGYSDSTEIRGGTQSVCSDGITENAVTYAGGRIYVNSGGSAVGTRINAAGEMHLSPGGIADNMSVGQFGTAFVYGNNRLYGTTEVNSGGFVSIDGNVPGEYAILSADTFSNSGSTGGTFLLDVDLEEQVGDMIHIVSSNTGNFMLKINNTADTATPVSGKGIPVVEYAEGAVPGGSFSLYGGRLDAGIYEYTLYTPDGEDGDYSYYLKNTGEYSNFAKTAYSAPHIAEVSITAALNSLQKRLGDLRSLGNSEYRHGTWGRAYRKDMSVKNDYPVEFGINGMEAGYDFLVYGDEKRLYVGLMAGKYGIDGIKGKDDNGISGNGKGMLAGAYLTYISQSGFFADFTARFGENSADLQSYSVSRNVWDSFSIKRNFYSLSAEAGSAFYLGQKKQLKLEPKSEIRYTDISSEKSSISNDQGYVSFGGYGYSTAMATLNASYNVEMKNGVIIKPYTEISYSHIFDGTEKITYSGISKEEDIGEDIVSGAIGLDMGISERLYWHGYVEMDYGDIVRSIGAGAGIRYMF